MRNIGTALLAAALATTGIITAPAGPSASAGDDATGGPVTGRIVAAWVGDVRLCSSACRPGDADYRLVVDDDGTFSSGGPVRAGTYRIRFNGNAYDAADGSQIGYLRQFRGDLYTIAKGFEDGTPITVIEGAALDVGTLDLQASFPNSTTVDASDTLSVVDSHASVRLKAKRIPKGATVTVRSHGCGKVRTTKVVRRAGTFRMVWEDPRADRHYGKQLELRATISKPGRVPKKVWLGRWPTSGHGWTCGT